MELLHSRFSEQEFICFTEAENQASMGLLLKLGYQDLGFIPKSSPEAFGKWLTPASEAELRQAAAPQYPRAIPENTANAGPK